MEYVLRYIFEWIIVITISCHFGMYSSYNYYSLSVFPARLFLEHHD